MRAVILAVGLVAGLAGCASAGDDALVQAEGGYPSLRDVPRTSDANVDPAYWARVERDLVAAGQAVKTHPRAAPAAEGEDPAAFLEDARRELEETRQSHEP